MIQRDCGGCTLCCKVMAVDELGKPARTWCPHCQIGHGCGSYDTRPKSCIDFHCGWLAGIGPDSLRPDKSKVIIAQSRETNMVVHVDPGAPDAWRRPGAKMLINKAIREGFEVIVKVGPNRIRIDQAQA